MLLFAQCPSSKSRNDFVGRVRQGVLLFQIIMYDSAPVQIMVVRKSNPCSDIIRSPEGKSCSGMRRPDRIRGYLHVVQHIIEKVEVSATGSVKSKQTQTLVDDEAE